MSSILQTCHNFEIVSSVIMPAKVYVVDFHPLKNSAAKFDGNQPVSVKSLCVAIGHGKRNADVSIKPWLGSQDATTVYAAHSAVIGHFIRIIEADSSP